MATKTPDAEAAAPPKSKKMLLIVVVLVLVLALAAVAGWLMLSKKNAAALDDEDEDEPVAAAVVEPHGPPTYLPLENMVVNLADPGGERVAQVGVTLELTSQPDIEKVKAYLPSIRSEILMLVSQRTADELLKLEGKEQLAADIKAKASAHFGKPAVAGKKDKKKDPKAGNANPIHGVLFSSFIVQ